MGALLIEEGKIDDAESLLKQFPKEPSATRQLARIHFIRDGSDDEAVAQALEVLESDAHQHSEQAEAHYVLGCRTALQGEWQTALEHFLSTVRLDRSVRNDGGRLGALDVFNVLGNGHEISREYTRRLSSLLF